MFGLIKTIIHVKIKDTETSKLYIKKKKNTKAQYTISLILNNETRHMNGKQKRKRKKKKK